MIGAFQAVQLVTPILLKERLAKASLLTDLVGFWQVWMILAWVSVHIMSLWRAKPIHVQCAVCGYLSFGFTDGLMLRWYRYVTIPV